MRELVFLLRGITAGLIISVPVGPVNVLCIHRTLAKGRKAGLMSGLGAAAGDTLYGAAAGFSITFVVQFLTREEFWIRLFGGLLLVAIGLSYFLREPALPDAQEDRPNRYSDFTSTFCLNLTNPTVVLSFLAVLAALGAGDDDAWWLTAILVGGIFSGSMLWWIVLCALVNRFRNRFNKRILRWTNRIAGLAIGGFGVAAFILSFSQ